MLARSPAIISKAFSPLDIGSSLLAWWNAGRNISATTPAVWTEHKGLVGASGGSAPTFSLASFNGIPGWTFNGSDNYFTVGSQPFPSGAADVEIYVVAQQSALVADSAVRTFFSYGGLTGATTISIQRRVLTSTNRAYVVVGNNTAGQTLADETVDLSSRHLIRARISPTTTYISVDGGAEASLSVVPAIGTNRIRIGANTADTPANLGHCVVSHVAITRPLSASTRAALTSFFMKRRRG